MSGTTAQDGFDYQASVAVCLTVEKINAGRKINHVRLEVRKPDPEDLRKNEFIVDIIIECEGSSRSLPNDIEITEVKGCSIEPGDLEEIVTNLDGCISSLYPAGGAGSQPLIKQLISRLPVGEDVAAKAVELDLPIVHLEDFIRNDTDTISSLEKRCQEAIEALLGKCLPPNWPNNFKFSVLFSIEHLFRHEIKRLAQKLRESESDAAVEFAEISFKKIMNHNESFSDVVAINYGKTQDEGFNMFWERVFARNVIPTASTSPSASPSLSVSASSSVSPSASPSASPSPSPQNDEGEEGGENG